MAVYKTTYSDPMNKRHTGYIIDGKTYKDKEGTQRIEPGSIVETLDGSYLLTQSGGVKANDYQKEINNLGTTIGGMKNNNAAQQEAFYNSKKAGIDNLKRQAQADYQRQAGEQYLKNMEAQKNINQILKAQGINGGMSESMLLANQLAHEDAVNDLQFYKADRLNELDAQLLALRSETDYNIAMGNSELDKLYLQYYDSILDRAAEDIRLDRELNSENFRFQKELEQNAQQFNDNLAREKELQQIESQQFYDELNWQKEASDREYALDERALNHEIANDNRSYSLNAYKAYNSGRGGNDDDEAYERALKSAEILAGIGDYSGYAELYGRTEEQLERAKKKFQKKPQ